MQKSKNRLEVGGLPSPRKNKRFNPAFSKTSPAVVNKKRLEKIYGEDLTVH
jgi:hypothetical protein